METLNTKNVSIVSEHSKEQVAGEDIDRLSIGIKRGWDDMCGVGSILTHWDCHPSKPETHAHAGTHAR